MSAAETLRAALQCGRSGCTCSRGRNTHCPAHQDEKPSLTIDDRDGQTLMNCKTGCSQSAVIEALSARGLWPVPDAVVPMKRASGEPDHLYRYVTLEGVLVAEHGRWNNPKKFAWRVPDGRWSDGLGGMPMESLPPYQLHDIVANPDGPVFIVEGEKAAEACRVRGLTAICFGGGASQQRFGNGLDLLGDRDVILWPDNDTQGQAFMARLAGLLPHARFINPVVPEKGDAYDYFAQGGTIEGLKTLLRSGQPSVRSLGPDSVEVIMPHSAGSVTFTFTEMSWTKRSLEAAMAVDVKVTGVAQSPYSTRINTESSSGRDGIRRELEQVFGKSSIEWSRMLSTACSEASQVWKEIDFSVDLSEVEVLPRRWFLDKRIPAESVTILFGAGGSGKSLLALDLGLHAIMEASWMGMAMEPVSGILIVDYEDSPDEWRMRAEQLCLDRGWDFPASLFRYLPGNAIPIHEQQNRIRALVKQHNIGLVIVDSASSASGGDLLDTVSVSRVVNFLQSLGVTVLMTAHNTKAEDSNHPYGSIMWTNLVRATHYVEQKQEDGSRTAHVTVWNRKGNRGKQTPIGIRIEYPDSDDGPIHIKRDDSAVDLTAPPDSRSALVWRMVEWLTHQTRPQSVREIATAMNAAEESVRKNLNTRHDLFVRQGDMSRGMWAAREKVSI